MIDPPCLFGSDKFAVLVGTYADVHEERGSLGRAYVVFLHVDAHVDGTLARHEGYGKVGLVGRGNFVSERCSHVVLDDPDLGGGDAYAAGYHHLVPVYAYRFGGEGDAALFVIVGVAAVGLKDHVGLA